MRWPFLPILLFFAGAFAGAEAQNKTWKLNSPCDNDFSVETPARLYNVGWFEGKHGPSMDPDEPFEQDDDSYAAIQSTPMSRQFGIVVMKVPRKDRREYERREFGGLYFMIGGDDVWPTTERMIRRNGLLGREYVYADPVAENKYPRGRIFYARGRLYFVIFVGATAADATSPDAERFLNSFRLRKRRSPGWRRKHR